MCLLVRFFVLGGYCAFGNACYQHHLDKGRKSPPSYLHQETLNVFLQWRGKLPEDCIEITVESRGGAADYQPQL